MHADQKLYLVFEFLDVDLKRYIEAGNASGTPLSLELCKVRVFFSARVAAPARLVATSAARWPRAQQRACGTDPGARCAPLPSRCSYVLRLDVTWRMRKSDRRLRNVP